MGRLRCAAVRHLTMARRVAAVHHHSLIVRAAVRHRGLAAARRPHPRSATRHVAARRLRHHSALHAVHLRHPRLARPAGLHHRHRCAGHRQRRPTTDRPITPHRDPVSLRAVRARHRYHAVAVSHAVGAEAAGKRR